MSQLHSFLRRVAGLLDGLGQGRAISLLRQHARSPRRWFFLLVYTAAIGRELQDGVVVLRVRHQLSCELHAAALAEHLAMLVVMSASGRRPPPRRLHRRVIVAVRVVVH